MSLVVCRYNKNHKVKPNRLAIHEAKCPDKATSKIKLMQCPYNPNHQIEEKDFEEHKINCPYKPNISENERKEMEEAVKQININEERKKINEARKDFYKECVNEDKSKNKIDDVEDYQSFAKNINLSNNQNNNSNKNSIKFSRRYVEQKQYDPNDEDKDIGGFSANIMNPDEISYILGKYN